MFCGNCGAQIDDPAAEFCTKCGARMGGAAPSQPPAAGQPSGAAPSPGPYMTPPPPQGTVYAPGAGQPKSKMVAGILGIVVGAFGVHRFFLGYTVIGIIQAVLGVLGILTCGITTIISAIWGLIEGIMILTGSINKDAQGRPLVD